jgi:CubicO group peptidase (beta-lactamase class C family)
VGAVTASFEADVAARAPADLGLAGERIAQRLESATAAGSLPGGTLIVADSGGVLLRIAGGWACVVGEMVPTMRETRYDLASLTKVMATVPLALALAQRGAWNLDDTLARWLPAFPRPDTTLRALLTHTSGLPAHREFYRLAGGEGVIRPAVIDEAATELVAGTVCYSDLGYMLLGWAIEECGGRPLPELFGELVARPLGMLATGFMPRRIERHLTAATELDGDQRLSPGLVWGEVHDGNAFALGGVAGHAGLFAPADDVARFARALLTPDRHPVLSAASLAEMTRYQAGNPPDVRALGWRLDAGEWGSWPARTCWHTGFTGTSILVCPEADLAVVLLLGGVHPVRRLEFVRQLRQDVHRELAQSLT